MQPLQIFLWVLCLVVSFGSAIPLADPQGAANTVLRRRHGGGQSLPSYEEAYIDCYAPCLSRWVVSLWKTSTV